MGRRSRSRSDEHIVELPYNASPIAESDYFQKSDEFRVWLRDEKRKVCSKSTNLPMAHSAPSTLMNSPAIGHVAISESL